MDCSIRQRRAYINVHHKTYERLGHEDARDLQALCRNCHRNTHGLDPNIKLAFHVLERMYQRGIREEENE
jgi:predicted HNH restriction endonuclease